MQHSQSVRYFGSALNSNVHFHALLIDGVYSAPDPHTAPTFHRARRITDLEVAKLLFAIRSRVLRLFRRRGLMGEEGEIEARDDEEERQGLLPLIHAASIQAQAALGPDAGTRIPRLGIPVEGGSKKTVVIKELCAELDGFTLHATTRVKAEEACDQGVVRGTRWVHAARDDESEGGGSLAFGASLQVRDPASSCNAAALAHRRWKGGS